MMSSTNCIFSALLNSSSLRRASNSDFVLTVYETVISLPLVNVFKSWVYSLQRVLIVCHERVAPRERECLPHGDVVIFSVHTPDVPLDSVSTVVQDEDYGGQIVGDHRREFLDSELPGGKSQHAIRPPRQFVYSQTSIANEKDGSSQL